MKRSHVRQKRAARRVLPGTLTLVAFTLCVTTVPTGAQEEETSSPGTSSGPAENSQLDNTSGQERPSLPEEAFGSVGGLLPEAPFGLEWLVSKEAVTEVGVELDNQIQTKFGETYVVSHLPKDLPDLHYAVLSFGYDNRLVRITAIGGGFDNDFDGHQIKARFAELEKILAKKYGAGTADHHTDKGYTGPRFAHGLQAKRNRLVTDFAPTDVTIRLSALWLQSAKTAWRVVFEHVPGMEKLERHRRHVEEEAL